MQTPGTPTRLAYSRVAHEWVKKENIDYLQLGDYRPFLRKSHSIVHSCLVVNMQFKNAEALIHH